MSDSMYWAFTYPAITMLAGLALGYGLHRVARFTVGRFAYRLAIRTESVYDDLIVDALHPFRFTWGIPTGIGYGLARTLYGPSHPLAELFLFVLVLVAAELSISLLSGLDEVYKHRPTYAGASVAGYFGLAKLLVAIAAIVVGIWLVTDLEPAVLVSGVGAWLAVLLLIFRETILNFIASIQIGTLDLVREGDWIEVPGYNAEGTVEDVALSRVKVRNFDHTVSLIPTFKIVEIPLKNWRGLEEMGARRFNRTLVLDVNSVKLCDADLLDRLEPYAFMSDFVAKARKARASRGEAAGELPLDGPRATNVDALMHFIAALLSSRKDLHNRRLKSVVRVREPNAQGLPVQVFGYTKTTAWAEYESVQAEIFNYIVAAIPHFDLQLCPTATTHVTVEQAPPGALQQGG